MYSFPSLPLFIRLFNFFNSFVLVLLLLTANLWLIFKFTVSLANKSDELNMKKITIA
ncbi:cytidylate kinase, partial [Bacteroides ovatus]